MPPLAAMSFAVRSPEPAAPNQCTSGQPGAAFAVPAVNPTRALPATATAQAAAFIRRNIKPPTRPAKTCYLRDLSQNRSHALQVHHKSQDLRDRRLRVVSSAREFAGGGPEVPVDPCGGVDGAVLRPDRLLRDEPGATADGGGPRPQRRRCRGGDQCLHAG